VSASNQNDCPLGSGMPVRYKTEWVSVFIRILQLAFIVKWTTRQVSSFFNLSLQSELIWVQIKVSILFLNNKAFNFYASFKRLYLNRKGAV
ncbi:MAG: hypothetical protein COC06_09100, partial [Bacteroidales bacterium]